MTALDPKQIYSARPPGKMTSMIARSISPAVLKFFSLIFFVSAPFWALGALSDDLLLPGLPLSALMVVCPVMIAAVLVLRDGGRSALWKFLAQSMDVHKMRHWAWIAALGTMPLVMVLSGGLQIASGTDLPPMEFEVGQALVLFAVFFLAATAEELGWTGFATRPLLKAHGILGAGLIIGLAAVVWHVLPLLQADRTWGWIAWWALGTIARRVLIVWVYARGGQSVFGSSLFHAMSNLTWMLFPVMGSHYDPRITALVLMTFAIVILLFEALTHKSNLRCDDKEFDRHEV